MAQEFKFLHLGINFKTKTPTTETLSEIEAILNKAKDWYRYAPNCWLIYTSHDAKTWHQRLRNISWITDQSYLICSVDLENRSGWLPKNTWEWVNQAR